MSEPFSKFGFTGDFDQFMDAFLRELKFPVPSTDEIMFLKSCDVIENDNGDEFSVKVIYDGARLTPFKPDSKGRDMITVDVSVCVVFR